MSVPVGRGVLKCTSLNRSLPDVTGGRSQVPCLMSGAGGCTVRSSASWLMVSHGQPLPLWTDRLTDRLTTYENITFPQLHWRATTKVNNILVPLLTKFIPRNGKHLPSEGDELNREYKTTYGKSYHQLSLPNRFFPYT